jgi:flavodoxin
MKKLVIYYSKLGNTEFVAEKIAKAINADMLELKRKHPLPMRRVPLLIRGGFQATIQRKPDLEPYHKDISEYDLLILGTPVWNKRINPTFWSFFEQEQIKGKKVAYFCTCLGNRGKTVDQFNKVLKKENSILGAEEFKKVLENREPVEEEATAWVKKIIKSAK